MLPADPDLREALRRSGASVELIRAAQANFGARNEKAWVGAADQAARERMSVADLRKSLGGGDVREKCPCVAAAQRTLMPRAEMVPDDIAGGKAALYNTTLPARGLATYLPVLLEACRKKPALRRHVEQATGDREALAGFLRKAQETIGEFLKAFPDGKAGRTRN